MNSNHLRIENIIPQSIYERNSELIAKREGINKKYNEYSNFLEYLIKTKIDFSNDDCIKRDIISFSELIVYILKKFFELYFELDQSKRDNIIDIISKFLIKLKRIEIINLILAYLQFINEVKNSIKFDFMKNCDFDYENDLNINLENVECNFDGSLVSDFVSIRLNFYNENEEKNIYLKSAIEKILKFNESSTFYAYFLDSDKLDKSQNNIIEIVKKNKYLILNEIKIKNILIEKISQHKKKNPIESDYYYYGLNEGSENENSPSGDSNKPNINLNLQHSLNFLEQDIANHIRFTKRNTSNFKKAFEDFKIFLLNNPNSNSSNSFPFLNFIKDIIPFGSVTQFSHNIKSDLEITIFTTNDNLCNNDNINPQTHIDLIKEIQTVLNNFPYLYTNIQLRQTKRTNLLNFLDVNNKVKIELMLDNYLGVLNSHLIRSYCLLDSRCIVLINIIKDWSKMKKINGNFEGYLSSYSYSLMVIYFMQNLESPILPELQTNIYERFSENEIILKNYKNSSKICENSHFYLNFDDELFNKFDDKNFCLNESTISEILLQFFIFYFYLFDENEFCIDISNKHSVYRYNQIKYLNYHNNKQFAYCFIDPFDYSYNPGCYLIKNSYQEERFKKEMEIAIENILLGKSIFE